MITRIDPPDYTNISVVQIDSDQGDLWFRRQKKSRPGPFNMGM